MVPEDNGRIGERPRRPLGTALLIVDMISDWAFPDGDRLLGGALSVAPSIRALKDRCKASGVPVIYANDNRGRWRSDLSSLVDASIQTGGSCASLTRMLRPEPSDYFLLKPHVSAFYGTPIEPLLASLCAGRIVLTGVASDQCILATAIDARMREMTVEVPCDCVATQSAERNDAVLRQFREVWKIPTQPSLSLDLSRPSK